MLFSFYSISCFSSHMVYCNHTCSGISQRRDKRLSGFPATVQFSVSTHVSLYSNNTHGGTSQRRDTIQNIRTHTANELLGVVPDKLKSLPNSRTACSSSLSKCTLQDNKHGCTLPHPHQRPFTTNCTNQ